MEGFLNNLHFGTRFLLIFMVIIYLIQFFLFDSTIEGILTFSPRKIIEEFQFWRLITGTFMHGGILHLCMNMLSFAQLGLTFESKVGTLSYFFHIIVFGLIESLIHALIAWAMYLGGDSSAWSSSAVGFSGVLFALIVVDISISGGDDRSVLGLFLVPSWIYPWVMLLVMSLLVQNASFLGHLSGIIAGYLYQFGLLKFLTPSSHFFSRVEQRLCCCCINHLGYISADGTTEGRPWVVFGPRFTENENENETETQNYEFRGHGRTVGNNTTQNETRPNNNNSPNIRNRTNDQSQDEDNLESLSIQLSD